MIEYKVIDLSEFRPHGEPPQKNKYCILRYHLYFIPYHDVVEMHHPWIPARYSTPQLKIEYDSFEEVEKRIAQIEAQKNKKDNMYLKIKFCKYSDLTWLTKFISKWLLIQKRAMIEAD